MLAVKDANGNWTQWVGQPLTKLTGEGGQFQLPITVEESMSAEELATDWGLKAVVIAPITPAPYGKVAESIVLTDIDSVPTQVVNYRDWNTPEFEQQKNDLGLSVAFRLNIATAPIINYYPEAERSGWIAKEAEARAYMASDPKDSSLCPLILGVATAQFGGAPTEAQLTGMAQIIIDKADAFRQVSVAVEATRIAMTSQITAVATVADLIAAKESLDAAITQLTNQVLGAAQS